jgi:predicted nucleic acid-binding Zn ribbon protein
VSNYEEWIAAHFPSAESAYGKCAEATLEMQEAFPELERVRGHYHCPIWGQREHWWLWDGEKVIDPTAAQFPSKGTMGRYCALDEENPPQEPTGMCPNCGEMIYDGGYLCSERCERQYSAYCSGR